MKSYPLILSLALGLAPLAVQGNAASPQAVSLLGEALYAPAEISPGMQRNLQKAQADYARNPDDPDAIIWYGRRIAYTGDYRSAIAVYSEGIEKHPRDSRLYRHRGHRYISVRDFDAAIEDLLVAVDLIRGKPNSIEPDGAPNARNIPVSTKHGNIWYHLGLAYYLKHDFEKALWAYREARDTAETPDNIVSTTHWIYMILRRLDREAEAEEALEAVKADFDVIENTAYYRLCLFYKGLLDFDTLRQQLADSPSDAATLYGLANWLYYSGRQGDALAMLEDYVRNSSSWASFGFIAAEVDLARAGVGSMR